MLPVYAAVAVLLAGWLFNILLLLTKNPGHFITFFQWYSNAKLAYLYCCKGE